MSAHPDLGLTARENLRPIHDLGLTDVNAGGGCGCGHGGGGCACGGHGAGHAASAAGASVVTELSVSGMTCGHCVKSVTEELAEIYGVNGVDVTLNPEGVSTVTVLSDTPLDRAHVAAAIEEAGYALAPQSTL
ncbi:heavy-metal-associated domain-containing protein [Mycetocola sp. 2940]|uniref:heavy-metal-associated domain-containing protein n=1 Tax=Mycetocola sp. 2940 TaxID=3156452 RepID=UPI00339B4883